MKIDTADIILLIEEAKSQSKYRNDPEEGSLAWAFNAGVNTMAATVDAGIRLIEMGGRIKHE